MAQILVALKLERESWGLVLPEALQAVSDSAVSQAAPAEVWPQGKPAEEGGWELQDDEHYQRLLRLIAPWAAPVLEGRPISGLRPILPTGSFKSNRNSGIRGWTGFLGTQRPQGLLGSGCQRRERSNRSRHWPVRDRRRTQQCSGCPWW